MEIKEKGKALEGGRKWHIKQNSCSRKKKAKKLLFQKYRSENFSTLYPLFERFPFKILSQISQFYLF
jgi:hypothetical protein